MTFKQIPSNGIPFPRTHPGSSEMGTVMLSDGRLAIKAGASSLVTPGKIGESVVIFEPDEYGDYSNGKWTMPVDRMENDEFGGPMFVCARDGKTVVGLGGHFQFQSPARADRIHVFNPDTGTWTRRDIYFGEHQPGGGVIMLDDARYFMPSGRTWDSRRNPLTEPVASDADVDRIQAGVKPVVAAGSIVTNANGPAETGLWGLSECGWALLPDGSLFGWSTHQGGTSQVGSSSANYAFDTYARIFPQYDAGVIAAGSTGGRPSDWMRAHTSVNMEGLGQALASNIREGRLWRCPKVYRQTQQGTWQTNWMPSYIDRAISSVSSGWVSNRELGTPLWSPKAQRIVTVSPSGIIITYNPTTGQLGLPANTPDDWNNPKNSLLGVIQEITGTIEQDGQHQHSAAAMRMSPAATIVVDRATGVNMNTYALSSLWTFETANGRWFQVDIPNSNVTITDKTTLETRSLQGAPFSWLSSLNTRWTITLPQVTQDIAAVTLGDHFNPTAVGMRVYKGEGVHRGCAEGSALVLPNGDYAYIADSQPTPGTQPNYIAVWDCVSTTATMVADSQNRAASGSLGSFVQLPDGHVLIYGSASSSWLWMPTTAQMTPNPSWSPVITNVSNSTVQAGETFTVSGTTLSGVSQGAGMGDDDSPFTNVPMFWLTNKVTGKVVRCTTHHWSYRGIQPGRASTMRVTVPDTAPSGEYEARAICNAIRSDPVDMTIVASGGQNVIDLYKLVGA